MRFDSNSEISMGHSWLPSGKSRVVFISVGVLLVLLAGLALAAFVTYQITRTSVVPEDIVKRTKTSIYVPDKLPGDYRINQESFRLTEDDTVLIFTANDKVGGDLVFSEQPKPKDFNYDQFYASQMEEPITLDGVRYSSVWGKTTEGRTVLSVVTDDTWIIVTTTAPLSQDSVAQIASGIRRR